jgi:hypothetical protein
MANNELIIKIGADADKFQAELDKIKDRTENLEGQLSKIAKVSGVAFAALTAEIGVSVHAFAESEKASKDLTLALQNQGIYSKKLADNYKQLAADVQDKTGIDDDALIASQAVLQSLIGQTEITPELTQALADLSIKTGDTTSAAEILGRAVQGNARGLKQFGIEVDDNLSKNDRLAQIIDKVSQRYGGLAEESNKGLGGIKGLKDAFSTLQEEIGSRFAPAITSAIQYITTFIKEIAKNQPLVDFISEGLKIGAVLTGLVATFATGALAIIKVSQAVEIASAAMNILGVSTRALVGATGLGLILIVAYEVYENWNKIFPAMQAVFQTFLNTSTNALSGFKKLFTVDPTQFKEGLTEIKNAFTSDYKKIKETAKPIEIQVDTQDEKKKAAADKAEKEARARETRELEAVRAHSEVLVAETDKSSAEIISLKKQEAETLTQIADQKNRAIREALLEHLDELSQLEEAQGLADLEKRDAFLQLDLESTREYRDLNESEQQEFLIKNEQAVQASIVTETEAKKAALKKQLDDQVASNNKILDEKVRFGAAYATINGAVNSSEVSSFKSASDQLVSLSSSKNATLKAIGKAAAVTQIGIDTAKGAAAVYANFQTAIPFPPVSIPLGIAAAGAIIAYGAERTASVLAAADGGLLTGGIPGRDSVPVLGMPGELVVPTKNFDEVVNAVANQRANGVGNSSNNSYSGPSGGIATVVLELKDDLMDFIETKLVERSRLNISVQGA